MLKKLLLAAAGLVALTTAAGAQAYPTRPITMVIPFAAGGPTDVLGRVMAQRMSEILGQQVVIENPGGAGGMTGSKRVAEAPPDGYMLVLGTVGTHAQGQTLYKKPAYNALTDFTPVGLIAEVPLVLIVRKDLPVNTFKEFVDYAKANQAKMTFASSGVGAAVHLGTVVLNSAIGVNVTHVPYRGSAPAMQDMQGGRVDYMTEILTTGFPQIQGGVVKAIAMLSPERSKMLPDVPTAKESGTDVQAYTWNALFLPKSAPPEIVKKLNEAMLQAMETPAVSERLTGLGASLVAPDRRSPEYLSGFVKSEIEKWAVPIKASGAQVD